MRQSFFSPQFYDFLKILNPYFLFFWLSNIVRCFFFYPLPHLCKRKYAFCQLVCLDQFMSGVSKVCACTILCQRPSMRHNAPVYTRFTRRVRIQNWRLIPRQIVTIIKTHTNQMIVYKVKVRTSCSETNTTLHVICVKIHLSRLSGWNFIQT